MVLGRFKTYNVFGLAFRRVSRSTVPRFEQLIIEIIKLFRCILSTNMSTSNTYLRGTSETTTTSATATASAYFGVMSSQLKWFCTYSVVVSAFSRVPTHTGKTGKPGKMREVFPVREKSGNFRISPESQGKVREFFYQSGKSQGKLDQKIILLFYVESLKNSCFQT